jgi:hypothetical protein
MTAVEVVAARGVEEVAVTEAFEIDWAAGAGAVAVGAATTVEGHRPPARVAVAVDETTHLTPHTLDPKPFTLNLKPSTLNPKP